MSNSHSTDDRRGDVLAAAVTGLTVSLIAISLRLFSRATSKKAGIWWDDWLSLASVPFIIVVCALSFWWVSLGLGLHATEASGTPTQWLLIIWIENLVYNTGLSLVKLSVILFYLRVFTNTKTYKFLLWATAGLIIAWCAGNNLLAIFQCIPVQSYWDLHPGYCVTTSGFLGTTSTNVAIDIIILVLPLPMLWRLQLQTSRKLALMGVFICGYCVVIVSSVRLVTIVQLGSNADKDLTWSFVNPQILVIVEIPIALFSTCLPSIFQLVRRINEKRRLGTSNTSKQITGGGNVHVGALGNPIGDTQSRFIRLEDQNEDTSSKGTLYEGPKHQLTNIVQGGKDQVAPEESFNFPSQQIHVRRDIDVEAALPGLRGNEQ